MSELSERLRTRHENTSNVYARSEAIEYYEKDREEAADEIERLRARNATLTKALTGATEFIEGMPVGGHMIKVCRRVLAGGEWGP